MTGYTHVTHKQSHDFTRTQYSSSLCYVVLTLTWRLIAIYNCKSIKNAFAQLTSMQTQISDKGRSTKNLNYPMPYLCKQLTISCFRNRWRCMQPRVCNYCWKTFSNSFNLKQHIVNVHVESQGVNCNVCQKVRLVKQGQFCL